MITDACAIDEPQGRGKVLFDLFHADATPPAETIWSAQLQTVGRLVVVDAFGVGLLIPGLGLELSTPREARVVVDEVDADERVVEVRARIAVRNDEPQGRLREHVRSDTSDENVGSIDVFELALANRQGA